MDNTTALKTLRLEPGASRSEIIAAYARLARRYPLAQFPDRHTRLLDAKQTLLQPEAVFKEILHHDRIELAWLSEALSAGEDADIQQMTINQLLAGLMRRPLREHAEAQVGRNTMLPGHALAQLLEEMGPEGLENLLRRFDPD